MLGVCAVGSEPTNPLFPSLFVHIDRPFPCIDRIDFISSLPSQLLAHF